MGANSNSDRKEKGETIMSLEVYIFAVRKSFDPTNREYYEYELWLETTSLTFDGVFDAIGLHMGRRLNSHAFDLIEKRLATVYRCQLNTLNLMSVRD